MKYQALLLGSVAAASIFATGEANAFDKSLEGGRAFLRCASCHSLKVGVHKAGPSLNGVIGRRAGSVEGYHYSKDLKKAGEKGLIWNHQTVHDFIGDPKGYLAAYLGKKRARTKMRIRYKDHDLREAVITILKHANGQNAAK